MSHEAESIFACPAVPQVARLEAGSSTLSRGASPQGGMLRLTRGYRPSRTPPSTESCLLMSPAQAAAPIPGLNWFLNLVTLGLPGWAGGGANPGPACDCTTAGHCPWSRVGL